MKIPESLVIETVHKPGSLAKVLQVIADAGLTIEHLSAIKRDSGRTLWEITVEMDEECDRSLYERIGQLPIARWSNTREPCRTFRPGTSKTCATKTKLMQP